MKKIFISWETNADVGDGGDQSQITDIFKKEKEKKKQEFFITVNS